MREWGDVAGPSGALNPTTLRAAAITATALGLTVTVGLAVATVSRAGEDAATSFARMAAALWELPGGGDAAATAFLEGRGTIETVPGDGAGALPGAHAYRTGDLEPAAWIRVEPTARGRGWPLLPTALALLGLSLLSAWAVARRRSPPPPRHPVLPTLLATLLLAATAASAATWADRALQRLSAEHAAHGARAVEVALAHGADPGHAPRVAGLPWATTQALESPDDLWTMSREVARTVAAAPAPPPPATTYTVTVAGATYHVARTRIPTTSDPSTLVTTDPTTPTATSTQLHLALLGYEATHSPTVPLAATAAASALATTLLLFLLPLSTRPRALRRTLTAWGLLAPTAVLLLLFTFGPLLFSLWISLHEWHLVDPVHPFTGIDNYLSLALDGNWWSAIRNTAVFTLHVPFAMAVALGLALLTRGSRRAVRWARLALFLPGITSVVAIAVVWKWLLDDGYGLVNRALERVGLDSVPWLTSPDTALVTLMAISVWMVVGYQMVVFQAGLAAIPRDWYDAARVDGAGAFQRFRHITLPGLRHTLFFVLVTSVIGSFQVFGLVYVMTEGGPLGATDVAVYHIYREAWEFLRFGNAAAMSWILFAVIFVATWLHFRLLERRGAHP
ncbi:MAG: sugar ABC transporter permease [Gemmatimonadota bacterium]|nr:sugar ABC transporter permease [Gemmatimonadota bacterium]